MTIEGEIPANNTQGRWPEHIVFAAKAAWASRQAGYSIVRIQRPATPLLKDWDDCPYDTREWMCAEANACWQAFQQWDRAMLSQAKEQGK